MQTDQSGENPEALADALQLLEAFQKLHDPGVRRSLISLAHAMRPDAPAHRTTDFPPREAPAPRLPVKRPLWLYALLLLAAIAASAIAWEVFDPAPIGVAASVICGRAR